MGAKVSKADVLNEVLNNVAVSVMVSTTSSGTSQISQSNTIDASGSENANVSKNIQTNIAKVNLSMISTTTQMSDIQSKLEAELKMQLPKTKGYWIIFRSRIKISKYY